MSEYIKSVQTDNILEICLARPNKRNALTDDMYAALADTLSAADANPEIAVAILYAEGPTFTAGNDLKDFIALATAGDTRRVPSVTRFLDGLTTFSKPLIAAVQGQAVGVGTTLLLHCDLVFAEPDACFSTPFVELGLTPEGASSVLMPARMGYSRAYAMLAMGEVFSAEAALSAGLINAIALPGAAITKAREAATNLAKRPPNALAITKRLMRGNQQAVRDQMAEEGKYFYAQTKSAEAQSAFMAFFQKSAAQRA
jgi:enoyl-CoA hydratase/carnithine racemase